MIEIRQNIRVDGNEIENRYCGIGFGTGVKRYTVIPVYTVIPAHIRKL